MMTKTQQLNRDSRWDWALFATLVGFWAVAEYLVARGSNYENSDGVTPFLQAADILRGNWALSGWTGGPDNYYTLDVLVSVACLSLFGFSLGVLFFQSLLTYGCLIIGAMRLSRAPGSTWWISGALLFLFLGLLTRLSLLDLLKVGQHVITLLVCLICFSLAGRLGGEGGGVRQGADWFAYGGWSFLALVGDPFYKYVGLLPILAATGLAAVRYGRWRALVKLSVVSGLALVLAKILVGFLQARGFHILELAPFWKNFANFDTIQNNFCTYVRSFWILLGPGDNNLLWLGGAIPFGLAWGFLALRLLAAVGAVWWTGKILLTRKSAGNPEVAFMDSVLLAGVGLDSAAYIFSTMPGDAGEISTCRYLVPAVVYASILAVRRFGPALSARWLAARPRVRAIAPAVFFAALLLFVPRVLELAQGQPNAADLQLADYLEARGLRSGFGNFWEANIITLVSRQKVKISSVIVDGAVKFTPEHWLSKDSWYDVPANFVVYNPSDVRSGDINFHGGDPMIKTFGRPNEITHVGPFCVLIWDHDLNAELDHPVSELQVYPAPIKFPLDLLPLRGQGLATGVIMNPDGSILDAQARPQEQIIIFGPYIHLPLGRYRVTFTLQATDAAATDYAVYEVTMREGRKILARNEISGRELAGQTAPATFTLNFECPSPDVQFEFRISKLGGMKLTLTGLTLDQNEAAGTRGPGG